MGCAPGGSPAISSRTRLSPSGIDRIALSALREWTSTDCERLKAVGEQEACVRLVGEKEVYSRGVHRRLSDRFRATYTPEVDKQAVYAASVVDLFADQLQRLSDPVRTS